ncbi:MAG: hypothetical protein PUJ51_23665 [Clostridiales bacterium]|uniref:hypothetical protein n=1 Tax=Terrisporobacter sp. TaxID=1965305 RepID=UPI002A594655|nr:hypothetical protein [Terrisporobacter sp.]MDD7757449.1 hypothetical protein [Clostridiales bacterium]MDY4136715.1 hypothetical protein [Terrisporobacter sp.]
MNEENVSVKISMSLIDDIELQTIDTFYNDIVSKYTKEFVKEKEQVIVQRLMMNLQQENARLKENNMSMQKEMARTLEKADLYKEVIEEVSDRITIKLGRYINEKDYVIDDVALDELLQILDKVKD